MEVKQKEVEGELWDFIDRGNIAEIINHETKQRPKNQKQFIRDMGYSVSTDPKEMNTHQAVRMVMSDL
ncbi:MULTISPECIES: hypothetical protein [Bacilli]|uniref:hypothetical protein n=1 Tax=Bacilli TaxID=91061 RepID=UPI000A16DAD3|nr:MULTISPECIES: hypothetical protein [Bacilli]EAD6001286.1 hypothetical protein [Listeria monocytogenes]EAD6130860.1 hypothetical protein [Listeria monocytogenes]EAD6269553.1 hypothetical protein [Listeria monocytogenes]EAE1402258.1 hypothetical protein [Listeria monocytogenes]EAE1402764.1 hypothetical protein [Listeria monocytogenes]